MTSIYKNFRHWVLLSMFALVPAGITALRAQEWTLERCTDSAMVYNTQIRMLENEEAITRMKIKEVKGKLLPSAHVVADYKYFFDLPTQLMPAHTFNSMAPEWMYNAAQFGVPHNIDLSVQAGMPLYHPGIYGNIDKLEQAAEVSGLKTRKSKEELYLTVANLYYSGQIVKNKLQFVEKNIENTHTLMNQLQLLKEQQLVTGTDIDKVQLKLDELYLNKKQLEASYERILKALRLNMGIDGKTALDIPADIELIELSARSAGNITDLELAKAGEQMADIDIRNARRSRLPSVMLYGSYGQTGYGYDEKPHDFLDFYEKSFVGLKIDIPIWDFSWRKQVNRSKLERENAALKSQLLADKIKMETANAENSLAIAAAGIESARLRVASAERLYNKTLLQHKHQIAPLADVLLADADLRKAQQDELDAIVDYLKAKMQWQQLTGNIPVK